MPAVSTEGFGIKFGPSDCVCACAGIALGEGDTCDDPKTGIDIFFSGLEAFSMRGVLLSFADAKKPGNATILITIKKYNARDIYR